MSGNVSETAHNLTPTKNCVIVKLNVAPCDAEELNHEYIGNNLGNIAQNANDNMVPPHPTWGSRGVLFVLVFVQLGSRFCVISFSSSVCATSLVFTSVYRFTIFPSVTAFVLQLWLWRLCTTLVFASVLPT